LWSFLASLVSALAKVFLSTAKQAANENAKAEDVGPVPSNLRKRFRDKLRRTIDRGE
tara:strand:+ start:454 stop:624 length:171 start_codon:yes stop_codon:yes gene_type:complete